MTRTEIEIDGVHAELVLAGGELVWSCADLSVEDKLNRFNDALGYVPQPMRDIATATVAEFNGKLISAPPPIAYSQEPADRIY